MPQVLYSIYSPKLDLPALKYMPNLHNILDLAEIFITKTRVELEFNSTIFIKNELQMKDIWDAEVVVIQNIQFCRAAPLGVKVDSS